MSHKPGAKDRFKCVVCGKGFFEKIRLKVRQYDSVNRYRLLSMFRTQFVSNNFRSIHTYTPAPLAHTTVTCVAEHFDTLHRFLCTRKNHIRNHNNRSNFISCDTQCQPLRVIICTRFEWKHINTEMYRYFKMYLYFMFNSCESKFHLTVVSISQKICVQSANKK